MAKKGASPLGNDLLRFAGESFSLTSPSGELLTPSGEFTDLFPSIGPIIPNWSLSQSNHISALLLTNATEEVDPRIILPFGVNR